MPSSGVLRATEQLPDNNITCVPKKVQERMYNVYDDIIDQLQDNKYSVQQLINAGNTMLRKMADIRRDLVEIQSEIFLV